MPEGLAQPIAGPSAWRRTDLRPEHYRVVLPAVCIGEIRRAAEELTANPLPTIVLQTQDFAMPACRALMAQARAILDEGARFVILDRLPVEAIGADAATAIFWLLASMIARPVAQKLDGTLVYDVRDTGRQALPGSGVRPDQTSIELNFHTDNSYNRTPPDYVGLLCLKAAPNGGHSRVLSLHSAHNALSARDPALLDRLYRPFWFDRQREYFPGEAPIFSAPVFERSGSDEVKARFSAHQIAGGYALKGAPVDAEGQAAIAALLDIFAEEAFSLDFDLAPGQIQFVHNRALGHARTAFVDHLEPERRRHLIRLWLRDHGRRAYPG